MIALTRMSIAVGVATALLSGLPASAGTATKHLEPFQRISDVSLSDALNASRTGTTGVLARSTPAASDPHVSVIALDPAAFESLRTQTRISIQLPIDAAQSLPLDLDRFDVLTPDAVIVAAVDSGQIALRRPDVQLWQGHVRGDASSRVFIGLTLSGAQGYVVVGERTFSISTVPAQTRGPLAGRTVVSESAVLRKAQRDAGIPGLLPPQSCAMEAERSMR